MCEPLYTKPQRGKCDWCKSLANDVREHRDVDEGLCGPVYMVCGDCIRKENDAACKELEEMEKDYDFYRYYGED